MPYKLIKKQELNDIHAVGYIYEHQVTKAKICFVQNDDTNKTFSIGFRTPPTDDTGVAHILEHSVLCGSKKYPVKDPFIELAKGSLNTFLNAMTYGDKTLYPVASVNDQDFQNLKDVYLDAVFHPNIYDNPMIFEQEGWHYELLEGQETATYKGVVYNEMKGVFSSPEQILFRSIEGELFKDHPYGQESGGDPMAIPTLTYEDFLNFHRTYYHPSNSYIFYYGNIDIEAELAWLQEAYLGDYDYKEVHSEIPLMTRYSEPRHVVNTYPIAKGEEAEGKTYLSYNVLLNESKEVLDTIGFDILEFLLIDSQGAPLKEALLRSGICDDVFSSYDGGKKEGTFTIVAKNSDPKHQDTFERIINEQLQKVIDEGFDPKKIEASINKLEFRTKEADFGHFPKGVMYAIKTLDTWLYDEDPFLNFDYAHLFVEIRDVCKEGFLQQLVETYLLNNPHTVHMQLVPDAQAQLNKQEITRKELEAYTNGLTEEEKSDLIAHNKDLIAYQEAPDTKEDLNKLPLLTIEDIPRDKEPFTFEKTMIKDTKLLYRESEAVDIAYVTLGFDIGFIPEDQLGIIAFMSRILMKMSTQNRHYSELNDEINSLTGGIQVGLNVYDHKESARYYVPKLEVKGKSFINHLDDLYRLIQEILLETDFTDVSRMRDLLNETKSRMQMGLKSAGHNTAITRGQGSISRVGSFKERIRGLYFYDELVLWQSRSDEALKDLGGFMKKLLEDIITADGLTIGITTSSEYKNETINATQQFVYGLPNLERNRDSVEVSLLDFGNEGIRMTSDVQYVGAVSNFKEKGFDYHGSLKVLNTIINLDYLWNSIRIKGGAYGAFSGVNRSGIMYFASYRDPNLTESLEAYRGISRFIESLDMDERELTKYIIGTISPMDQPLTASMENDKMLSIYHSEITHDDIIKSRHEVLDTTLDSLKVYRELYQKVFTDERICVLGGSDKVDEAKEVFDTIRDLQ